MELDEQFLITIPYSTYGVLNYAVNIETEYGVLTVELPIDFEVFDSQVSFFLRERKKRLGPLFAFHAENAASKHRVYTLQHEHERRDNFEDAGEISVTAKGDKLAVLRIRAPSRPEDRKHTEEEVMHIKATPKGDERTQAAYELWGRIREEANVIHRRRKDFHRFIIDDLFAFLDSSGIFAESLSASGEAVITKEMTIQDGRVVWHELHNERTEKQYEFDGSVEEFEEIARQIAVEVYEKIRGDPQLADQFPIVPLSVGRSPRAKTAWVELADLNGEGFVLAQPSPDSKEKSLLSVGSFKNWSGWVSCWDWMRIRLEKRLREYKVPTASGQQIEKGKSEPKPWEIIEDRLWDRKALELWHTGLTCREIEGMLSGVTHRRIRNRLSELRGIHGEQIVPYKEQIRKMKIDT